MVHLQRQQHIASVNRDSLMKDKMNLTKFRSTVNSLHRAETKNIKKEIEQY